ncbi:hypothetical protein BpHYR1_027304 [Brachionus plicatilis]|uniref:Uncharacterized protein n=1 Tax=Brachionus plicatilis TaxID=10195 RepID=A0A3M7T7R5_BRAPC|nr:hypothetical protein BpHYR1_027304 [Brachionus plicatilis]
MTSKSSKSNSKLSSLNDWLPAFSRASFKGANNLVVLLVEVVVVSVVVTNVEFFFQEEWFIFNIKLIAVI